MSGKILSSSSDNDSESSDDNLSQKKHATFVMMGFEKVANVVVDSDIPGFTTMHKQSNEISSNPPTVGDLKRLDHKALNNLISSKTKKVKALDCLITVKEKQLSNVQDKCEDYTIKTTSPTRLTPEN